MNFDAQDRSASLVACVRSAERLETAGLVTRLARRILRRLVPLVPDNWRLYAECEHCSISVVPFIALRGVISAGRSRFSRSPILVPRVGARFVTFNNVEIVRSIQRWKKKYIYILADISIRGRKKSMDRYIVERQWTCVIGLYWKFTFGRFDETIWALTIDTEVVWVRLKLGLG